MDRGHTILPYLYRAVHEFLSQFANEHYNIGYSGRVDAENKPIGPDAFAVPFRLSEIDSKFSLKDLSRIRRDAPDAEWRGTIDQEILSDIKSKARFLQKMTHRAKTFRRPVQLIWQKGSPEVASIWNPERVALAKECAQKLRKLILHRGIFELGRRDACRLLGKPGRRGVAADALHYLSECRDIQMCPMHTSDYASKAAIALVRCESCPIQRVSVVNSSCANSPTQRNTRCGRVIMLVTVIVCDQRSATLAPVNGEIVMLPHWRFVAWVVAGTIERPGVLLPESHGER